MDVEGVKWSWEWADRRNQDGVRQGCACWKKEDAGNAGLTIAYYEQKMHPRACLTVPCASTLHRHLNCQLSNTNYH